VDSLDLAELSQIIEENFGVELSSNDVSEIKTVGDAIDIVADRAK
jgi:acyl carrier protein